MERGFGWHYPPGCTTYQGGRELELVCVNEGCPEYGRIEGYAAFWELGSTFLRDEDEWCCNHCGEDRIDEYDFHRGMRDGTYPYPEDLT